MESNNTFECGICYYQSLAKDFTPITVSANFAALECPKCFNNDPDCPTPAVWPHPHAFPNGAALLTVSESRSHKGSAR